MNIILFDACEIEHLLPLNDARVRHVTEVIGCTEGDVFDVGLVDGPRGKARIVAVTGRGMELEFNFAAERPQLYPVEMVIGLPRPPSARRMLKDLTTQGVEKIHFVATDKGERSYLNSRLWTSDEYRRLLREGAEQAFCTRLPTVVLHESLDACMVDLASGKRLALDNYEADMSLAALPSDVGRYVLGVGSERGWSTRERSVLRDNEFTLVHLGQRVLKTETASIVGLALVLGKLGAY